MNRTSARQQKYYTQISTIDSVDFLSTELHCNGVGDIALFSSIVMEL